MSIYVIYHRADFDGLFCREIARRFHGDEAEYIGWDYGDPVPEIPLGARIDMLDISIPELMHRTNLYWIDHHKTAMDRFSWSIPGLRIDGVAACRLAWQCYFGTWVATLEDYRSRAVREPLAVRLAGEYDIWDKRDEKVDLFQAGLRGVEVDYKRLLDDEWGYTVQILHAGEAILRMTREADEYTIRELSFTLEWFGLRWLAVNSVRASSDLFKTGLQPHHQACLSFCWNGKKERWKVSLRGAPGHEAIDLSVIAAANGGGGHRGACGFECSTLPWTLGANVSNLAWEAAKRE